MVPGKIVAVEGASAAGKTTALAAVAEATGWTVVPEAYRRITPTPSLQFHSAAELLDLERRLLEEDARRYSEARARARTGVPVLADTGFLGPLTYTWALVAAGDAPRSVMAPLVTLARTLGDRGKWGLADAYLYLETPRSVRSVRAAADPTGHPAELAVRHAEIGALEERFYRERVAPLLGPRFQWLAGGGPAARVAVRVEEAVRASRAPRPAASSFEAVLALFGVHDAAPKPSRGNR